MVETSSPNRTKLRTDKLEPKRAKFRIDISAKSPERNLPNTETWLPMRMNDRIETEEPKLM
jgi:hypothetical protein